MGRPRKKEDQLHCIKLNVWLTDELERKLLDIADRRDCPKGIVAREALMIGLEIYQESLQKKRVA